MKRSIYCAVGLLMMLCSCVQRNHEFDAAVMVQYLRMKQELEKSSVEACKKAMVAKAEIYVDSILMTLEFDPLNDDMYKPELPERPFFVPVDSSVFLDTVGLIIKG